ncbi:hypothetical protein GMRT_13084 [Giardia muris]|uniref:Uncharacterized protein n=1 Tax=Giardia muris TaxID=5742 RepID=A0A4Z1SX67_GIAMU|nr:hypothetical protein GMRT_13084 [Giardia muris]|eukprot:TNJ30382.1 hypothetical protein GMRT_13084 [Giardia muris]
MEEAGQAKKQVLLYDEFEEFGAHQEPDKALEKALLAGDTWMDAWTEAPEDPYIQALKGM